MYFFVNRQFLTPEISFLFPSVPGTCSRFQYLLTRSQVYQDYNLVRNHRGYTCFQNKIDFANIENKDYCQIINYKFYVVNHVYTILA